VIDRSASVPLSLEIVSRRRQFGGERRCCRRRTLAYAVYDRRPTARNGRRERRRGRWHPYRTL